MYVTVHGETRLTIYITVISMFIFHLCHMLTIRHRCLQSCVGTCARLGYAAFDAQLQKAYFVTTLYAIQTSVHA